MKDVHIQGRVLLVDDDATVVAALARQLKNAGFDTAKCTDGVSAIQEAEQGAFDVIITDISMPGMDGIELLRAIRERDPDLPVILLTGKPSIETAADAVEYGAVKYVRKPFDPAELIAAVSRAAQLRRLARAKREALALLGTGEGEGSGRASLSASFERALASLWMAFQPIVRASDGSVFGYEALLRSEEPSLPHPGAVLDAAERLDGLEQLGRTIRGRAVKPFLSGDPDWRLFLNLHPSDLGDPDLVDAASKLSGIANRVVLEITERASLERVPDAHGRVKAVRELGFCIAVDDLGAGYAGLSSFVHLEPEFVKLDMSLVRDIDTRPVKRKLVESMTHLCQDMGLHIVAEGIETAEERDVLVDLGCDLLQGYRFAKPGRPFVAPVW